MQRNEATDFTLLHPHLAHKSTTHPIRQIDPTLRQISPRIISASSFQTANEENFLPICLSPATSFSCYIPNKTHSKFTCRCYLFWPFRVSRFVTVPTYLSTYLPTYLSIHRFVKVASRFSLLNHRIPLIACLFETFLRASEFSKTKCIVSALPCAPPPLPPLCFEFRKSSLRERLS